MSNELATAQTVESPKNSAVSIPKRRSNSVKLLKKLVTNPGGLIGLVLVLLSIICAIFAPWLAPHSPTVGSILDRLTPPAWVHGGSSKFLLGTDAVGRDQLSRIIFGARVSLYIGLVSVILSLVVGVPVGLIAGFYGRFVDDLLIRISDTMLSFPFILFAILVMALFGPGVNKLIIVLGLTGWVQFARVVRGETLRIRELEYITAARALGAKDLRIMIKYVLPGTWSPIIVIATMSIAVNILLSAGLSFLGLGVDPSIPDWGGMIAAGQLYLTSAWWVETFPGIAIMLTVLGFNLLGDWIRDVTDPILNR